MRPKSIYIMSIRFFDGRKNFLIFKVDVQKIPIEIKRKSILRFFLYLQHFYRRIRSEFPLILNIHYF